MKIVIFGCGKIGKTVIGSLAGEGHDIIALDKDQHVVEEITNIYDVMGLCGNGVDSDAMMEAGVAESDLFVAVTNSDELNMLGCFLARKMGAKIPSPVSEIPNITMKALALSSSIWICPWH